MSEVFAIDYDRLYQLFEEIQIRGEFVTWTADEKIKLVRINHYCEALIP